MCESQSNDVLRLLPICDFAFFANLPHCNFASFGFKRGRHTAYSFRHRVHCALVVRRSRWWGPESEARWQTVSAPRSAPPRPTYLPAARAQPPPPARSGDWPGPAAKRNAPSISSLQRELQQERERFRRSQESVEQLRLEMQMMGRVFAGAREQALADLADSTPQGRMLGQVPRSG